MFHVSFNYSYHKIIMACSHLCIAKDAFLPIKVLSNLNSYYPYYPYNLYSYNPV